MKFDQKQLLPILLMAGGGYVLYLMYKTGKSITDVLNITSSKEEKEAQQVFASEPTANPFSPLYYKELNKKNVVYLFDKKYLEPKAKAIHDAVSKFPLMTDSAKIATIIKSLQYKTQVSYLSEYFQNKYGYEMFTYIKDGYRFFVDGATGLSDKDMAQIINYVNNLPSGIKNK